MPAAEYRQAERNQRAWRRDERLRRLGYRDYTDYLRSSRWRSVKDRFWRDPNTPKRCVLCGEPGRLLLHHKTYDRVGAENLGDLAPMCGGCHELVHALEARGDASLGFEEFMQRLRAERYRAEQVKRHDLPSSESLRQRQHLQRDIAKYEQRLARARRESKRGTERIMTMKLRHARKRLTEIPS